MNQPYTLPELKGHTIVHQHLQGFPCVINPQADEPIICRYERTVISRILAWFN